MTVSKKNHQTGSAFAHCSSLEYGFYIDGKGNRLYPNFLVEWEGNPEAFACQYPYIIAFEPSFIEIRHIITVRSNHLKCSISSYCF
jgi:hypothetical protein